MYGRFMAVAVLLSVLLLLSGGCSKRRQMIEQLQGEIVQCEKEIEELVNDEEWRMERDEVVNNLALENQGSDVHNSICKALQDKLSAKYSMIVDRAYADIIKAISFDNMGQMFQVFCEEPAIARERVSEDMRKKIEKELDIKNLYQIFTMLEEKYPMFSVADPSKGVIKGDYVKFNKVNGAKRVVEGNLNAITDSGARFGSIFCPYEDMPDEIVIRLQVNIRKRFFRLKSAEIQQEQNVLVNKRLREELPNRFIECGYLPNPSKVGKKMDLTEADSWISKRFLLEQAYREFFTKQMISKNYEYTEFQEESGKEWIPKELLDKIGEIQSQKQVLQTNLQSLKKKRR